MVTVQYVGPIAESFTIRSVVDRTIMYRFGNNAHHAIRNVFRGDLDHLFEMTDKMGNPMYRLVETDRSIANNNPAAVLGQAVA